MVFIKLSSCYAYGAPASCYCCHGLSLFFLVLSGKSKEELGENYWDLVVITASDELQRDAYEKQINDKLKKKEIPSGIPYLVYADPPGPRAGTERSY